MSDFQLYNPLDKASLGASVAEALLCRKVRPLAGLPAFDGAGVYAIYYTGTLPVYLQLSSHNQSDDPQAPIYVGKAVPDGARKGRARTGSAPARALYRRLREHAESIEAAENLKLSDFVCRVLVVDDIWIPLGESLLIAKLAPIWNSLVDGFGNHDPGRGRHQGQRPRWDVLHPGRAWAMKCQPHTETAESIAREVEARLASEPSLAQSRFLAEERRVAFGARP